MWNAKERKLALTVVFARFARRLYCRAEGEEHDPVKEVASPVTDVAVFSKWHDLWVNIELTVDSALKANPSTNAVQ